MNVVEAETTVWKYHPCLSCCCPSLGPCLLPLRVSFLPSCHTYLPPRITVLLQMLDMGYVFFGDTYGLATESRDGCVFAFCGLQKWSRHPCTEVSIGIPSPHTSSESRRTFHPSYYGLFYSLTHIDNIIPKWI